MHLWFYPFLQCFFKNNFWCTFYVTHPKLQLPNLHHYPGLTTGMIKTVQSTNDNINLLYAMIPLLLHGTRGLNFTPPQQPWNHSFRWSSQPVNFRWLLDHFRYKNNRSVGHCWNKASNSLSILLGFSGSSLCISLCVASNKEVALLLSPSFTGSQPCFALLCMLGVKSWTYSGLYYLLQR